MTTPVDKERQLLERISDMVGEGKDEWMKANKDPKKFGNIERMYNMALYKHKAGETRYRLLAKLEARNKNK